jgi:TIR domain
VPGFSSRGVFLSYRREDAAPYARLLQYQLGERFPDAQVFMDLDSIEAGLDFAQVITEAVDSCAVLVALIGRQWATLADEGGRRRLDDPDDFVRFEVRTALERGVRVIPVLVDGAKPLRRQQLPAELHKLARLNALELSYGRYQYDADRLLDLIQEVLADGRADVHRSPPGADAGAPIPARPGGSALREPAQKDSGRVTRILTDAERAAQLITNERRQASALAVIAEKLATTDPARAARLIADAERIAQSIPDGYVKARALADVAEKLAAVDPDRSAWLIADAERAAQAITDGFLKASVLATIAGKLAAADPDRVRLIAGAERAAQGITGELLKANALADVV